MDFCFQSGAVYMLMIQSIAGKIISWISCFLFIGGGGLFPTSTRSGSVKLTMPNKLQLTSITDQGTSELPGTGQAFSPYTADISSYNLQCMTYRPRCIALCRSLWSTCKCKGSRGGACPDDKAAACTGSSSSSLFAVVVVWQSIILLLKKHQHLLCFTPLGFWSKCSLFAPIICAMCLGLTFAGSINCCRILGISSPEIVLMQRARPGYMCNWPREHLVQLGAGFAPLRSMPEGGVGGGL